ncbi:long-chain-fatty-acid--CoA ligase 5-like [Dermatophagoides pteronyssinus]|uniref:long-chain-fatty-acid--CoA ligase 5-like n=1 Tax=Dermatophagoides pteronyssinus TaxID=6956 RepID=UPI003F67FF03
MALNVLIAITLSVATIYFYVNRKSRSKSIEQFQRVCGKFNYDKQSLEQKTSQGEVIRYSKLMPKDDPSQLNFITHYYDACRTMNDVLPNGAKLSIDGKCVGSINKARNGVDWLTYEQVLERNKHFGDGLLHIGLKPNNTFGIYSMNTPEYTIAEYACYRHSIVVIPIYETLGSNICAFIAKQAELSTIFCDNLDRVVNVLNNANDFQFLKNIIVSHLDDESISSDDNQQHLETLKSKAQSLGLTLYSMNELEQLGQDNVQQDHPPGPNDLAVICYTSGTTDAPKGVMLSHENVVANFSTIMFHLDEYHIANTDTLISYLPLGHMFERVCESGTLAAGGKIGYFSGDIKRLSDDMKIIKPTFFPCVPRVLNKIYSKIHENVSSSAIKSWLLKTAFESKLNQYQNGIFDNNTFWDMLIFNKIRALFGGHVRLIPVGSAPINGKVLNFLRCALGCHILEGYGQTECVSAATVTTVGHYETDHVGVPLNAACIKLVDVPDMDYLVSQGKGEVLIKGSIVFKGYYKDPKKTQATIDQDGWLYTGDIGKFNENGTIKIIDRKKDIFKLAQGEYIAPSKIEDVYMQSPFIQQIFVYGDSYKSCLIAIVVPNLALIQEVFKTRGKMIDFNNNDELRENKEIKQFVMEELQKWNEIAKLKSFEKVRDIHIYPEGFTIEDGLLTPTLKNRRFALKNHFKTQIEHLYSKLE